ncbi:amidase family protein [Gemella haemolysans]|uniref:LPXTG-motif cell wall anchor domain protein n=1 Tax=Gemella haemolysans ATCC 10379 TaxID=546270 RepID=C5NV13_9BACL|nr:amidase family protein [Gemella haemolysans]EER69102.1 LPXTG-motif cell wall anchor domain protein [Gemella haemolysans ATCC 10379]KAA8707977.1 LPXTG cell wall anchor domain-containing protein [Gemella haemolysans]UBH81953.1 LPXTG cell wall anchor domain-containing protein [Gemella haemolysans]VEI38132.1 Glutamyl-tRNA(Gln) amidotransferase subunit A [Gemella haemolysans]
MKKNNIKYVLIPAFAAATLFPVLANDNQAKANEDKATTTSTVSNTENTNEKTTNVPATNNVAKTTPTTPANIANSVKQTPTTNTESTNSASIVDNEIVKPKVPFTVTEYKQKSALELAQLIREKKVTSTELVDLAYKVIAEENPKLNAVLTTENGKIPHAIVEEAYRTAKEIDDRVKAGNLAAKPIDWKEQPFLGVPTLIKGLDELKNGDYTKGVYLNKGKIADKNGPVAAEFAKLGFVILGQTNTPELGTRNITDSKLFGPASNPWDPSRNTGGSSGGSAGAVASGMVPIASGSDAGGSIRIPSSWTGLIGLKPTGHVVKFPLVKTIEDAKAFFEKTELSKPKTLIEPPKDLKKLKIAYTLKTPLKDLELSDVAKKAILQTVDFLRKEGFTVEEVKEFPIDGYEGINTYTVGAIGEEGYVAAVKGVTEENKRQLDPATYALGTSSYMGPNANTDISSVKPLSTFINQMNEFYKKYDLFLVPTNAVTAPSNDKKVDPYVDPEVEEQLYNINKITDPKERFKLLTKQWLPMTRRSPYTWVFNLSGNPAISLPTYLSDKNLPFGVMFAAKDNSEKVLLEIGQYFQDRHQFKMNPAIRSTNVSENGNKIGVNEYGTKYEYAVPTYAPSVAELPTLNINNETATTPSESENSQTTSVKEEKKVVNTNRLNSISKTLPNTGENTNNFLSAIGLSFLALIGLLKRKKNN